MCIYAHQILCVHIRTTRCSGLKYHDQDASRIISIIALYVILLPPITVADPGFPVGGAPTRWGGANLRRIHFSVKTYVKMKEIDPVGGGGGERRRRPPWIRQ